MKQTLHTGMGCGLQASNNLLWLTFDRPTLSPNYPFAWPCPSSSHLILFFVSSIYSILKWLRRSRSGRNIRASFFAYLTSVIRLIEVKSLHFLPVGQAIGKTPFNLPPLQSSHFTCVRGSHCKLEEEKPSLHRTNYRAFGTTIAPLFASLNEPFKNDENTSVKYGRDGKKDKLNILKFNYHREHKNRLCRKKIKILWYGTANVLYCQNCLDDVKYYSPSKSNESRRTMGKRKDSLFKSVMGDFFAKFF